MWLVGKFVEDISGEGKLPDGKTIKVTLPMCWAAGMVGACPVFEKEELARKYAGDAMVIEINFE